MEFRLIMILLLLALLPLGSSSIFIEPLNPIYNYGDQIDFQTILVSPSATSSHYIVDLKCGQDSSLNIYNSFFSLQPNVEKPITVSTELLNILLENTTESCLLQARFGNEVVESTSFIISNKIIVHGQLEFNSLNPGNYLYVSGNAVKESGIAVNGFAEIFIDSLNLYKSSIVSDGSFNFSLLLPSDSKSGKHDITIEIHTTDSNSRKINFGSYSDSFNLNQILKEINIVIDDENAQPQKEFTFRVDVLDQAKDAINRDVSITVSKPKGIPFIKKVIRSGEIQKLDFFLNDTPGYWSIEATVDDISDRKLFYLIEINTLQTSLINNTLFVTNIGNSPYNGPLEITIGSFVEVKQIKLNHGETQKFTLRAPEGDYSISILESGENKVLGNAFLTGNAIKVTDFREDVLSTFTSPLIWWLGIFLLLLIIVLVRLKVRMQNKGPKAPVPSNIPLSSNFKTPVKPDFSSFKNEKIGTSLFSQGSKLDGQSDNKPNISSVATNPFAPQKVSPANLFETQNQGIRERAVALSIYSSISSPATNETLNRSLSIAQEVGSKIYIDGEYKIILFSPRLTHTSENDLSAINVGRRIQALFLEHMKLYHDGAKFGIGISDGEIISEIENGKFHFTSTGNLISYAKRLAYASNSKLFVSDSVRRKVISTVKTEKSNYAGAWEVVKITDHSTSREFIKKFSDRNKS